MIKKLFSFCFCLLLINGNNQLLAQGAVEDEVYSKADQMPQFKGGDVAFRKFINKHLKYPQEDLKNKVHGTVYLSFVVNMDGSIQDVTVETGVNRGLDKEAVRLIRSMPKWIPGSNQGKPVRVRVEQRISFKLA